MVSSEKCHFYTAFDQHLAAVGIVPAQCLQGKPADVVAGRCSEPFVARVDPDFEAYFPGGQFTDDLRLYGCRVYGKGFHLRERYVIAEGGYGVDAGFLEVVEA